MWFVNNKNVICPSSSAAGINNGGAFGVFSCSDCRSVLTRFTLTEAELAEQQQVRAVRTFTPTTTHDSKPLDGRKRLNYLVVTTVYLLTDGVSSEASWMPLKPKKLDLWMIYLLFSSHCFLLIISPNLPAAKRLICFILVCLPAWLHLWKIFLQKQVNVPSKSPNQSVKWQTLAWKPETL